MKLKKEEKNLKEERQRLEEAKKIIIKLNEENEVLYEENKSLRYDNENQKELLEKITKLALCNTYNNAKVFLDKIKELAYDYQSLN